MAHSACPFCAGHEDLTPATLAQATDSNGAWQVRIVPNKYPAVAWDGAMGVGSGDVLGKAAQPPSGAHEVFIESPRHVQDIVELSVAELAVVLRMYRDRLRYWSADHRTRHVTLFKNVGSAAGASLEHVHSQLVALPSVPPVIAEELDAGQRYYAAHQACLFCDLLSEEVAHQERLVLSDESFVAFCAYAARQPYETWVMPKKHAASFEQLSDIEAEALAKLLQQILRGLGSSVAPLAYNLLLHTAPCGQQDSPNYHWHFELVPRSTRLAGLEWATGMHINPLAPERAAARLRERLENKG